MKARLKQHAAPWLIALALLASTSALAAARPTVSSHSSPVQAAVQTATSTSRLVWDRVGAPMQAAT